MGRAGCRVLAEGRCISKLVCSGLPRLLGWKWSFRNCGEEATPAGSAAAASAGGNLPCGRCWQDWVHADALQACQALGGAECAEV